MSKSSFSPTMLLALLGFSSSILAQQPGTCVLTTYYNTGNYGLIIYTENGGINDFTGQVGDNTCYTYSIPGDEIGLAYDLFYIGQCDNSGIE